MPFFGLFESFGQKEERIFAFLLGCARPIVDRFE
jgi:hypothetical protein